MKYLIESNGNYWLVREDGSLQKISAEQYLQNKDDYVVIPDADPDQLISSSTSLALFFDTIAREAPESLPESGFESFIGSVFQDLPLFDDSRLADSNQPPLIDSDATIAVTIVDGGDEYVNQFENSAISITGTTTLIPDNQIIQITLADSAGSVLEFSAVVTNGGYSVNNIDVSGFAEGVITATASATDFYGNTVTDSDTSVIDTLAVINNDFAFSSGPDLSLEESQNLTVSGTTDFIEAGQPISLIFSDISGNTITVQGSINADGSYQLSGIDVSSLDPGTITVTAESVDIAGNPASNSTTLTFNTSADISLQFDGDRLYSETEIVAVTLSGSTTDVESGQVVTVTVSDGTNSLNLSASVQPDGSFQTAATDFSAFNDGRLNATATVQDVAGNSASDTAAALKDTVAEVTINFDGQPPYSAEEVTAVDLSGTISDVFATQPITVEISDGVSTVTQTVFATANGIWSLTGVDLSSLNDGPLTAQATVTDIPGNVATASTDAIKDTQASLSLMFDGDLQYSASEITAVSLSGTSTGVEPGQIVELIVSDAGQSITVSAEVQADGSWQTEALDLSSFDDGSLAAVGRVQDIAGNSALASDQAIKDTEASIELQFDGDLLFSSSEIGSVTLSGSVLDIEAGQPVQIQVSDGVSSVDAMVTVQADGSFQTAALDLSALNEGPLLAIARSEDVAGNPASTNAQAIKNTQAGIELQFDGDGNYSASEIVSVSISGTTTNVAPGQTVSIDVADLAGNMTNTTALVQADGSWATTGLNLSAFVDGELSAVASVLDLAGNTATDSAAANKDTQAAIDIDFDGAPPYSADEVIAVTLSGSTTEVEAGQTVSVAVTDGSSTVNTSTVVQADGSWQTTGLDLSGLSDGILQASASVVDLAGNPTSADDYAVKNTTAFIELQFDGDLAYSASEDDSITLSGTTGDVAPGQTITLIVSDTVNSLTVTTTVQADGSFQTAPVDLTAFNDGPVFATASVVDVAGNFASDSAEAVLDRLADITVQFDGDQNYSADEIQTITVSGLSNDVEAGQNVSLLLTDSSTNSITVNATVLADGSFNSAPVDLSSFVDGPISVTASTVDVAGNPASGSNSAIKNTAASLSMQFDGDGNYSENEINAVSVSGSSADVEAGQLVSVAITDGTQTINTTATIQADGSWQSPLLDLTALQDGLISATAEVVDQAGNPAFAGADANKDTLASLDVEFVGDQIYDANEISTIVVSGSSANVEPGQVVNFTVSDISGQQITGTATLDASGNWQSLPLDLSGFDDGSLFVSASTTDLAGNTRTADNTAIKNTQAGISVNFDGDELLNGTEITAVTLSGQTTDVAAGQQVSILITDGSQTTTVTAIVGAAGDYQTSSVDLSSFNEGKLLAIATVTDVAGNTANAADTVSKDTLANIDVQFDGNPPYSSTEIIAVTVSGDSQNIEAGQTVNITITDDLGSIQTTTALISEDGSWQTAALDLSALDDGSLSADVSVSDIAGNPASASANAIKNTNATLDITFDGDQNYSVSEQQTVTLSGATTDVAPGQTVEIIVTDGIHSVSSSATVQADGSFQTGAVDIRLLDDGLITTIANVEDIAGNTATASDTANKDSLADLQLQFNGDGVYSDTEIVNVTLGGVAENIEPGTTVTVTVTDGVNSVDSTTTIAADGSYTTEELNLEAFDDGALRATATATDLAGNTATSNTAEAIKNTVIGIDIQFDGNPPYSAEEVSSVSVSGSTTDVLVGSIVDVRISDGNTSFNTKVAVQADGSWQADQLDLSILNDGAITATARVVDYAGNSANASTDAIIDTLAAVDIQFDGDLNFSENEIGAVSLSGTTSAIEQGQQVNVLVTDGVNNLNTSAVVQADGSWQTPALDLTGFDEGALKAFANVVDIAGNIATDDTLANKDTLADIDVQFDGDRIYSASEISAVTLSGSVSEVEAGQPVSLQITDGVNNLAATATVAADGSWQTSGLDFSGFNEGPLFAIATVTDQAGNIRNASTQAIKDTQSAISIQFDGDQNYSAAEVSAVSVSGTTSNVAPGQTVSITITDSAGNLINSSAVTQPDGSWQSPLENLSAFVDGPINATASVVDLAGNPGSDTTSAEIDTQAAVDLQFDGNPPYDADESLSVSLSGSVNNIESGQTVDIVVSDDSGNSTNTSAMVSADGSFQTTGLDLSGFSDGPLTATASVTDLAGNTANDQAYSIKNTVAVIDVVFDGDQLYSAFEVGSISVSGTTTDVAPGQTVSILLTDTVNSATGTATVLLDGSWQSGEFDLTAFNDGDIVASVSVVDIAGNLASSETQAVIDTQASIDVVFEGDQNYGALETGQIVVSGTTQNVEPGQDVDLLISDSASGEIMLTVQVQPDGSFSSAELDLSAFSDGPITVTASTEDLAGNTASDNSSALIDTQVGIDVRFDGDRLYSATEITAVSLSGTVSDVEPPAQIEVVVTDGVSTLATTAILQADSSWQTDDLDLSAFNDGALQASATVVDAAGNTASDNAFSIKDTVAQIDINFDGNPPYSAAEITQVSVSGSVQNVEPGRTIQIEVSDGVSNISFNAVVNIGGSWQSAEQDLSSLQDGILTATATVSDLAGNVANDTTTAELNTFASISLQFDGDQLYSEAEVPAVSLSGATTDVAAGQIVTVIVSDGSNITFTTATVLGDGSYQTPTVDLSAFNDGEVSARALVRDTAGNTAQAEASAEIDILADVAVQFDGDLLFSADEIDDITISGTVNDVEAGQTIDLVISDAAGNSINTTAVVQPDLSWVSTSQDLSAFDDGSLSVVATVTDVAGNTTSNSAAAIKNTQASIDIQFDGDQNYSQFEIDAVTLSGTTQDVLPGQTVNIVVSDNISSISTTAVVQTDGSWQTGPVDLSALNDGELLAVATVTDLSGNIATALDSAEKDTVANLDVQFDGDQLYSVDESAQVTVSGSSSNVEAGQTVVLTVRDSGNNVVAGNAVIQADGSWQSEAFDLSSFADGPLSVNAIVRDQAGNIATAANSAAKDGSAEVMVQFDGDKLYDSSEIIAVTLSGSVSEVEAGQTVSILVSDGTNSTEVFAVVAADLTYQTAEVDLSGFNDGLLRAVATVSDLAGNTASSENAVSVKDTQAAISIAFDGDQNYSSAEVPQVSVSGSVTQVAPGRVVDAVITDGTTTINTTATVQIDGSWQSPSLDISSLQDGEISASASVVDLAGNSASASTTANKDTVADISITFDGDPPYSSSEIGAVTLSGNTTDIEAGQQITVFVTDTFNTVQTTATVNADGSWQTAALDLSAFNDSLLNGTALVEDQAGNSATATTFAEKDTLAAVSISFDGDQLYSASEITTITLSGSTTGVEAGQTVSISISDGVGTVDITATVQADGSWQSATVDLSGLNDGTLTATADVSDVAGNQANDTTTALKDTVAVISAQFDGDQNYSQFEDDSITLSGTVNDVEVGQVVSVTVTDGTNNLTTTAAVQAGGIWQTPALDLSGFNDGPLNAVASVTDQAGNSETANASATKNTQATIEAQFDGDLNYSSSEITAVSISGTTLDVAPGQTVNVLVSDGAGSTLLSAIVQGDGSWQTAAADLSGLNDGNIFAIATVVDLAGNPASDTTQANKDTLASINLDFDGDQNYSDSEKSAVSVSGTVANVEPGQTVSITVADTATGSVNTTAVVQADLSWQTPALDLSAFADGTITATANVEDLAGNTASNSNTALIDTLISIDIDTSTPIDISTLREGSAVVIQGTTTGVEAGQTVSIRLADSVGNEEIFTALVQADGSWSDTVAITGLAFGSPWTLDASVTDVSGNSASDSTPTLINPTAVTLSEDALSNSPAGAVDSSNIRIENYDTAVFSTNQPDLTTVLSGGVPLTVSLSPDQLTLTASAGATPVLTAVLNPDGTIDFNLLEPVDQQIFSELTTTSVRVEATQNDSDATSETVAADIPVSIRESLPFANDDAVEAIEAETLTFNVFDNDNQQEGPLTVISFNVEGLGYTVSEFQPTVVNTSLGELVVNSNGEVNFTSDRNLDNNVAQQLPFTYFALDSDKDFDRADVLIDIQDGSPIVAPSGSFESVEPDLGSISSDFLNFRIEAGSDDLLASTLRFQDAVIQVLENLSYTSNGTDLDYVLAPDGSFISAFAGAQPIFTYRLTASDDGAGNVDATIRLTQFEPLDHNSTDILEFPILAQVTDIDGTITVSNTTLIINDGSLPYGVATANTVLEDDLPSPITVNGSLIVAFGSDVIDSLVFTNSGQPQISSGGTPVQYSVTNGGLTLIAYTSSEADPVFEITIDRQPTAIPSDVLSYDFTLYKPLDQLDKNGNSQDPLNLALVYQLNDFDGDDVTSSIDIEVFDSSAISGTDVAVQLSEKPTALPNLGTPSQTTVDFTLSASKDPITSQIFDIVNNSPVLDTSGNHLSKGGEDLFWQQVTPIKLQAQTSSGDVVLELDLPDTILIAPDTVGTVTLEVAVLSEFDHLSSDNLVISVPVIFNDSDNTSITLNADISIFDGRNPVIVSAGDMNVTEASLISNDGNDSDTSNLVVVLGSDEIDRADIQLSSAVTSQGQAVNLAAAPDSQGWWVATDGSQNVFRLRINNNGVLEFESLQPLDHPVGDGENNLPIDFDITLFDKDGDFSNLGTLTVNVKDDVPVDIDFERKLTEGSSKTVETLQDNNGGADGAELTKAIYDGVEYVIANDPVVITLTQGGQDYGTATITNDGKIKLDTVPSLNASFEDVISFEVTDFDGDIEINNLTVKVRDEEASIDIEPVIGDEDTLIDVVLTANPGDVDNGEVISSISFDSFSLQGGTLYLDGVELSLDGNGNPQLTAAQLRILDPATGEVVPDGTLQFLPALNTSDPTHTVTLNTTVTVQDLSGTRTHEDSFDVNVNPVVDAPIWDDGSGFNYFMLEDGTPPDLNLSASLFDTDGSEELSYRIDAIDTGLELFSGSTAIGVGELLDQSQIDNLRFEIEKDLSGLLGFTVVAIATEASSGDSFEVPKNVTVLVEPVPDTPTISTNNVFMLEDELVALGDFIDGSVSDGDGSETLGFALVLPTGWTISDAGGNDIGAESPGQYRVTSTQVDNNEVFLKPLEDISSVSGSFSLQVNSFSTESFGPIDFEQDSETRTVQIEVQGVVDQPAVTPGPDNAWAFDGSTLSGSFDEDQLVALNFGTGTEDDDGSEQFDFLIRGIPDTASLVDSGGSPANVPVVGQFNGSPVYSVTAAQLANLFIKPQADFSGIIQFELLQTNTEPDGDTGTFNINVEITMAPVIDTSNGLSASNDGLEDEFITLNLNPALADQDGSESLTNIVLHNLPADVAFYYDLSPIDISSGTIDLQQLAADQGVSFDQLITEGKVAITPPEDASGVISIDADFEVLDTSPTGATDVVTISGSINASVLPIVDAGIEDGFTRLEAAGPVISADGSPIALDGLVTFTEEDIDGSEVLDYISISIPESDGWFVTHPNGAIHDGQGNWLFPANGLTSDTVQETLVDLLGGATIVSDHVGVYDIDILARVLDGNNHADIIQTSLQVDFQVAGTLGSADPVSQLQTSIIDGQEAENIDTSGHIDVAAAGDADDVVSFRVDAGDLPYGAQLTGSDVLGEYDIDGTTLLAYLFTDASLGNLALTGLNEDFAGATSLPVNKVSTDPLGDTVVTLETLQIEIEPVVDQALPFETQNNYEDIPVSLDIDLAAIVGDSSTAADEGLEVVTQVVFQPLTEGTLLDPNGILSDPGDGTLVLNDPSRIDEISFLPPLHKHGQVNLDMQLVITDTTQNITLPSLQDSVTSTINQTLTFELEAVTDPARIITTQQRGDEDSDIALNNLFVIDVDSDGSETLAIKLSGVPNGAVVFWDNGGSLQQLPNEGSDGAGGTSWTIRPDQLNDLVFRPPRDFAGDIALTLEATSMELSTQQILTTSSDFILAVDPIADGAIFLETIEEVSGQEGARVEIPVNIATQEQVNPNETLLLQLTLKNSSDPSAINGAVGISDGAGNFATFENSGTGDLLASINIDSASFNGIVELVLSDAAFGSIDVDIAVGSVDSALVLGTLVTDNSVDNGIFDQQSFSIDVFAVPTAPILTVDFPVIEAGTSEIPLGLGLTAVNPAPGETASVEITGLPDSIVLSNGVKDGFSWIVQEADIEDLAITNAQSNEVYTMTIRPVSQLENQEDTGSLETLTVRTADTLDGDAVFIASQAVPTQFIGGEGDDSLTGSVGIQDQYLFRSDDLGSAATPSTDTITDFEVNTDQLNLSDIIAGLNTGAELDTIINLNENAGTTTLEIDLGGGVVQNIDLQNVSKDDLFGGSGWSNDSDILQRMITDQILISG